jgi:hypothetical protein
MPLTQYPEGSRFTGMIGRTADESSPAWPTVPRAPKDSPDVLFVVPDDTGLPGVEIGAKVRLVRWRKTHQAVISRRKASASARSTHRRMGGTRASNSCR